MGLLQLFHMVDSLPCVWACVCVWWGVTHQVDTVHDADSQGHERLGEVNHLLALCCDGESGHCQVSFLKGESDHVIKTNPDTRVIQF